ncbi:MAG: M48 family metallopeptidase [Burkholderiaceae bacterium]
MRCLSTMLCEQPVHYELCRPRRRTIGFVIDERGLRVTAPFAGCRWARSSRRCRRRHAGSCASWSNGATTKRVASGSVIRWHDGADAAPWHRAHAVGRPGRARRRSGDGDRVARVAAVPARSNCATACSPGCRRARAKPSPAHPGVRRAKLGRTPSRWALSSARTRGSCTPDGAIRLNWRLVHFPMEIVDYVIAHELAHLRELNHGPRFWSTVGELFPDFERARAWLRDFPDDMPVG